MSIFRSIVFSAALAGLIVGLVITVAQQFGTVPLILSDKRLKLIGPLPRELQSYLVYVAAIMKEARSPDAAMDFVRFLGSPSARAAFTAAGAD